MLITTAGQAATTSNTLELANDPLLGPGVKPNVVLLVDDSGTMDFEVLFPTASGALYWPPNGGPLVDDTPAWENGQFVQDVGAANAFAYLFPNGINQWTREQAAIDGTAARHDQRLYRLYKAAPPVPYMGFTRSPDYNTLYFNPFVEYDPWVHEPKATPNDAYYDPIWEEGTLDLTSIRASDHAGTLFTMGGWMYMPPDREWINLTVFDNVYGLNLLDVLESVPSEDLDPWYGYDDGLYDPPPKDVWYDATFDRDTTGDVCVESTGIDFAFDRAKNPTLDLPGTCLSWADTPGGATLAKMGTYAIKYYPATFYLSPEQRGQDFSNLSASAFKDQCLTLLPDSYGDENAIEDILIGDNPTDDSRLCGYQIRHGTAAMANFANWFTYYRKRHLAVRGAVLDAFDNIHGIRASVVTFSEAAANLGNSSYAGFDMLNLNKSEQRKAFYQAIKQLNFSQQSGTPTRQALKYVGEVLENDEDVITHACQTNFAIVLTDGYNRAGVDGVGDVDGDGYANTMADVAMQYYRHLDPDQEFPADAPAVPTPVACNVAHPPLRLDCNTEPHLNTYAIALGQRGEIFHNPNDDYTASNPYANPPKWPNPNPVDDSVWPQTFQEWIDWVGANIEDTLNPLDEPVFGKEQIDDLWHATLNGHGDMLLASKPREITTQLTSILRGILVSSGTTASLAASDQRIFQPMFASYDWSGDLVAYEQGDNGGPSTVDWRAAEKMPSPDARVILTNTAACSNSDAPQAAVFATDTDALAHCGLTDKVIRYVRGDRSEEFVNGGDFRNRYGTVLGDIVHSDPIVVGQPQRYRYPRDWQDALYPGMTMPEDLAPDYSHPLKPNATQPPQAFAQKSAQRTPVVYVGANDGMLHGFNAETGEEVLAYIPGVLLDELDALTDPAYAHQPYVDGSPVAGDVVFDDTLGNNQWRTVLVGGLRGGGQAIYALDVTDPSQFSQDNADKIVLWEFTHPDLGYTYGQPSIVRLHNGEWAAVFGNGYNSDSGAQLFVVDIETGSLIAKIKAQGANGQPNGLAQPTPVDVDGDFIVDYFYAGDLQGNLWKFDLTAKQPNQWQATQLFATADDLGKSQPITTAPVVGRHPYGSSYGVMVYFGTGKLLEQSDTSPVNPQHSFYGIWDPNVLGSNIDKSQTVSRGDDLVEQNIIKEVGMNGSTYRVLTDYTVNYGSGQGTDRGWYIDLIGSGEVVINTPYIRRGVIGFSTALPAANACLPGGRGFIMRVSATNGGRTNTPTIDADRNGSLSDKDKLFQVRGHHSGQSSNGDDDRVAASGVRVDTGRPSEATFVPGTDRIVYNTTSGTIRQTPAVDEAGIRKTWRVIRPVSDQQ